MITMQVYPVNKYQGLLPAPDLHQHECSYPLSPSENQSCPFSPNGIQPSLLFLYNLATLKYKQPIKANPTCLFSPLVWDRQNLIFSFPTWAWDQLQIKGVSVNLHSNGYEE